MIEFLYDDARPEPAASLSARFADIAAWLDDGRLIDAERGILSRKDVAEDAAGRAVCAARKANAVAYVVVAVVLLGFLAAVVLRGITAGQRPVNENVHSDVRSARLKTTRG